MGFWGDKKDDAKDKAVEAAKGAATWPFRVVKEKAVEKYLRSKGKWITGECVECGKPIAGGQKKPGLVHKKCWKDLNNKADKWETKHRSDGSSRSGNHFTDCNCNENWRMHECKARRGEEMNKF